MKVRPSRDVVSRDLAGEAVLLDLATGTYYGLDGVGTRIWSLLGDHERLDGVVAAMLDEYDVDEDRLRDDVAALVRQLRDRGLVSVDEEDED